MWGRKVWYKPFDMPCLGDGLPAFIIFVNDPFDSVLNHVNNRLTLKAFAY
jgi:hypothetical protein